MYIVCKGNIIILNSLHSKKARRAKLKRARWQRGENVGHEREHSQSRDQRRTIWGRDTHMLKLLLRGESARERVFEHEKTYKVGVYGKKKGKNRERHVALMYADPPEKRR